MYISSIFFANKIIGLCVCQDFYVHLPKNHKTYKFKVVMFNERIKPLREDRQIQHRKLAAEIEIDTAMRIVSPKILKNIKKTETLNLSM